jgi:phosphoglycerate dehydrogenase-like enzyme
MIAALSQNKIRGAVLDVFATEPLPESNKLWELPNVFVSPHTADRTATWLDETMEKFVENAQIFSKGGQLLNIVDKQRGY